MACSNPVPAWMFQDTKTGQPVTRINEHGEVTGYALLFKPPANAIPNREPDHRHRQWVEIETPCKKCRFCKLAQQKDWAQRCSDELKHHAGIGTWLTITYDEDNLPKIWDGRVTVKKEDLQAFLRLFRQILKRDNGGETVPVKYFGCGEYGETFGRPHYHILIFGWKPQTADDIELLNRAWSHKGHIKIGDANSYTAYYTAKYTGKLRGERDPDAAIRNEHLYVNIDNKTVDADYPLPKEKVKNPDYDPSGFIEKEFLLFSKGQTITNKSTGEKTKTYGIGAGFGVFNKDAKNNLYWGFSLNRSPLGDGKLYKNSNPTYYKKVWKMIDPEWSEKCKNRRMKEGKKHQVPKEELRRREAVKDCLDEIKGASNARRKTGSPF